MNWYEFVRVQAKMAGLGHGNRVAFLSSIWDLGCIFVSFGSSKIGYFIYPTGVERVVGWAREEAMSMHGEQTKTNREFRN